MAMMMTIATFHLLTKEALFSLKFFGENGSFEFNNSKIVNGYHYYYTMLLCSLLVNEAERVGLTVPSR